MPETPPTLLPSPPQGVSPRSRGRRLARLLPLAFTVGTLAVLFSLLDLRRVGLLLLEARPLWLGAAFVVALLDRLLMIGKWYPLALVHEPALRFSRAARAYLAANFAAFLLPSTVGADGLRALALGRERGLVMEMGASIVAERLFGMLANGLLVLVSFLVALHVSAPIGPVGILALGIVAVGGLAGALPFLGRPPAWLRRVAPIRILGRYEVLIRRFFVAYVAYRRHPRMLAAVGALTFLESLAPLAIVGLVSIALESGIGLVPLIVAVPVASLIAKLPISVAGIGPQEASLVSVLALFGVSGETGLAIAVLRRLIELSIAVPGGLLVRDLLAGLRSRAAAGEAALTAPLAGEDRSEGAGE